MSEKPLKKIDDITMPKLVKDMNFEITEQDKERCIKSMMLDEDYTDSVKINLFGKPATINFRTFTTEENGLIFDLLTRMSNKGLINSDPSYTYQLALLRLSTALVSYEYDGKVYTLEQELPAESESGHDDLFEFEIYKKAQVIADWSNVKARLFITAFQYFEAKLEKLINEVVDVSFYKAGEAA